MYAGRWRAALAGTAALCALALVGPAAAQTLTAKATQDAAYADPTGDSKSAPDVSTVAVSLDPGSGALVFGIQLANNDNLSNNGVVVIGIDADRNPATGNQGDDYAVVVGQSGYAFLKWDGKQMSPFSHQPVLVGTSGSGLLAIGFCSCDLGTQTFNFWVGGLRGNDIDAAPDNGDYAFPQSSTPSISFDSILVSQKPLVPKAGKRFTVNVMGAKLDTGEVVKPDSYSCTATLAGRALKGSGTGGCSWALSKKARGKKLVVNVTISYQGVSDTFSASYKVR
jgi:hypothetical protein